MWRAKAKFTQIEKTNAQVLSMPQDHIFRAAERMGARLDLKALQEQRDQLVASITADMEVILDTTKSIQASGLNEKVSPEDYKALVASLNELRAAEAELNCVCQQTYCVPTSLVA